MTLATCETIGQGLISWLNRATPAERDAFCLAVEAACGAGKSFVTKDGETITISGDGSEDYPYKIGVLVDPNPDNGLTKSPTGLFVGNASLDLNPITGKVEFTDNKGVTTAVLDTADFMQGVVTQDSPSVTLTGDGTSGLPIRATVTLSESDGNSLTAKGDGLYVASDLAPSSTEDAGKVLRINAAGEPVWVDIVTQDQGQSTDLVMSQKAVTDALAQTPQGSVTSVDMAVPDGFTVQGVPITDSGVIELGLQDGFAIPSAEDVAKGVEAFEWGNHAEAGYLEAAKNLSDLVDVAEARTNLGLGSAAERDMGDEDDEIVDNAGLTIIIRDTLRRSVEMASGGRNTVLYTAKGQPSHHYVLPAFNWEDTNLPVGTGLCSAFIVGGVEKSEIFPAMYQGVISNGEFISLPGVIPSGSQNIDQFTALVRANGPGWHLMTNAEWMAIALWCYKNGYLPTGNNNWGRDYAQRWQTGVREDGLAPGDPTGQGYTLTGSGPAAWRHDNTSNGIADLNGNKTEWTTGLRLWNGEIQVIPDNDAAMDGADLSATSTLWKAIRATDGALVNPGTAGTLKYDASAPTGGVPILSDVINTFQGPLGSNANDAYAGTPLKDLGVRGVTVPAIAKALGIYPVGSGLDGDRLWTRNYGERVLLRGGDRSSGSNVGVFLANLNNTRTLSTANDGARPSFVA